MVCDSGRGVVVAVLFRGIQPHVSPAAAKRALFVGGLIMLAVAGYVLAAPSTGEALPPPPPCVPDTMEHYIGQTCTIGDKSFSDFQYGSSARGGAVAVPSSGVLVTPLATPGNPGFTFGGPWAAASDRPAGDPPRATSSDIFFDVRTISGAALIEDASLESVQSGTGGYGAGASAILCLDSAFPCSGSIGLVALNTTNPSGDSVSFTPASRVGVAVDGVVDTGEVGGVSTGALASFTIQFSEIPAQVPEPGTVALLGPGLFGLLGPRLVRRRRVASFHRA